MMAKPIVALALVGFVFQVGGVFADSSAQTQVRSVEKAVRSVTVPFVLDHNRMVIEVELVLPDGNTRKAKAWVDTGQRELVFGEALARELGLDAKELKDASSESTSRRNSKVRGLLVGGMGLDIDGIPWDIHPGKNGFRGVVAEVHLPASALLNRQIVFDYPKMQLTIALPGVLKPRGAAVPCRVNRETGLFLIEVKVDGKKISLGVDNGSAGTWVSTALTQAWQARHPDWPFSIGAVGSTNFFGFGFEAKGVLMSLPEISIGPLKAAQVALLGLDPGLFDWYSKKSAGPVVGFLGANVLKKYRVEIDYHNQVTYWESGHQPGRSDIDVVGLTLRPEEDESFTIAGVASKAGKPTVEGVLVGDRLIKIDDLITTKAGMGDVVDALRGIPGAVRTLVVEREGKQISIKAEVTRFP